MALGFGFSGGLTGESNRDGFNETDGLYDRNLELTPSREDDGYRGLMTLDVAGA